MEEYGYELDITLETDISVEKFRIKFFDWLGDNGWVFGATMKKVPKNKTKIIIEVTQYSDR